MNRDGTDSVVAVQEVLRQVSEMLGEGVSVDLLSSDRDSVELLLVVQPGACLDCVLSPDVLEAVCLERIRTVDLRICEVTIVYPPTIT